VLRWLQTGLPRVQRPSSAVGQLEPAPAPSQIEQLKDDLERRQRRYIQREFAYKTRVEELEAELEKVSAAACAPFRRFQAIN
jgi:hypothetical protein